MNKLELVCPAGNREALEAAVEYGADSVYLGGSAFGARASAVNFDDDALVDAVSYAHRSGVRILLTVNTLILENELDRAIAQVDAIHRAAADGLIVQDLGLAGLIRKRYPRAPIHGSTQMAIHNIAGAKMLEDLGFRRVVLARECSLEDMAAISDATSLELEAFCHGALCVSVSGACLMSSVIGGRSGNRGRCAQPCRLPYNLLDGDTERKSGYMLSPRDLCALPLLEKMAEAGITAFKIEGRLKRPGYVAHMTKTYRQALDAIEHGGGFVPNAGDIRRLASVFSRGGAFTTGYAPGKLDHTALMTHSTPTYPENPAADTMPEPYLRRKPAADAFVRLVEGEVPVLRMQWNGFVAKVRGEDVLSPAQKQPAGLESVRRSLKKTGDTPFVLGKVEGEFGNAFISVSQLNALRRDCLAQLEVHLTDMRTPDWAKDAPLPLASAGKRASDEWDGMPSLWAWVPDVRRALAALEGGADGIYLAPELWDRPLSDLSALQGARCEGKKIYLALPLLLREKDFELVTARVTAHRDEIDGVLAPNAGILRWALENGIPAAGDIALNITNPYTRDFYLGMDPQRVSLSPELTAAQVRDCARGAADRCEAVIHGRIPLMTLAHCPTRASANVGTGGCNVCRGRMQTLRDRKGMEFPLRRTRLTACQITLHNSLPMSLAVGWEKLPALGHWRVILLDESPEMCRDIICVYRGLIDGADVSSQATALKMGTTAGHWFRGIQ